MTQASNPTYAPGTADAGGEIARLAEVLALVEEMAGLGPARVEDEALDECARVSAAYAGALPIDQRRFDRAAAETARWAAVGVEALLRLQERRRPVEAAAGRLAQELRSALNRLSGIVPA